jgi:hypothetical protein
LAECQWDLTAKNQFLEPLVPEGALELFLQCEEMVKDGTYRRKEGGDRRMEYSAASWKLCRLMQTDPFQGHPCEVLTEEPPGWVASGPDRLPWWRAGWAARCLLLEAKEAHDEKRT